MSEAWWQGFFDEQYLELWAESRPSERTNAEADGIWSVLGLQPGARVLDAPCGYGRLSQVLAERGARVVGVDYSAPLLAAAESRRGTVDGERLRYLRADLRQPLAESGFDAAINIFSSIGYGSEDDDLAILTTLRRALVPGGKLFLDTNHRDAVLMWQATGARPAHRLSDGTIFCEEPRFDAVAGRVETTWYWQGPRGGGQKSATIRLYCVTELLALLARAGFAFASAHRGCSPEPFRGGGLDGGGRVGILAIAR
jgi:SAM-dependent methyltransferase